MKNLFSLNCFLIAFSFSAIATSPPEMSQELLEQMKVHAVDSAVIKVAPAKQATEKTPVSIIDEILGQAELKALNITSVAQLPKAVLEEIVANVVNDGPPPELISLKRKLEEALNKATLAPLRSITGLSVNEVLSVSPGSGSVKLRLLKDMDTTIEFYDQAGNPWPVANQRVANDVFQVTKPDIANHILYIRPSVDFVVTNLSILLDTVNTSFSFMLSTNEHPISGTEVEFDERIKFTVPLVSRAMKESSERNPQVSRAVMPIDGAIGYFLDQSQFEHLKDVIVIPVLKGDATAYLYEGSLYVRTTYESFVFPGSAASSRPENNIRVYKAKKAEPILTFYHDGKRQIVILDDDILHTANQQFLQGASKTGAYSSR